MVLKRIGLGGGLVLLPLLLGMLLCVSHCPRVPSKSCLRSFGERRFFFFLGFDSFLFAALDVCSPNYVPHYYSARLQATSSIYHTKFRCMYSLKPWDSG